MELDTEFQHALSATELRALRDSRDTAYVVDTDLVLRGWNSAYEQFAAANGATALTERFGLGASLLAIVRGSAADFYRQSYLRALQQRARFDHDYECSSPRLFRRFHQTAYPLRSGRGLLVTHHIVHEYPHAGLAARVGPRHFDETGWLTQCACCRKIRDRFDPAHWDWIPRLVESMHPRTTHSFCPHCLSFYYGDFLPA